DRVQLPRVTLFWHTTPNYAPDDAALDVLAYALARGKSSQLYRALVHDQQLAQDVTAGQDSRQISGAFSINVTAKPGHSAAEVEKAVLAELDRMKQAGPSAADVARIQNTVESEFIAGLEQIGGNNSVSDRLNGYNHFLGEPNGFQKDLDRYMKLSAQD